MIIDMHVHEKTYSLDSRIGLEEIIDRAKQLGLDAVCITDHESNSLMETAHKIGKQKDFLVFVGAEILTYEGDILVFGLDNIPQKKMHAEDLIDIVNDQGGVAISAHPYRKNGRGMGDIMRKIEGLSGIEGLNGSTPYELNSKACEVAIERQLPILGGSDAHKIAQLGKYATYFHDEIRSEAELIKSIKDASLEPVYYSYGMYYKYNTNYWQPSMAKVAWQ